MLISVRSAPFPAQRPDLGRRDADDRGEQDVDVVEDPVEPLGVDRLGARARGGRRPPGSMRPIRIMPRVRRLEALGMRRRARRRSAIPPRYRGVMSLPMPPQSGSRSTTVWPSAARTSADQADARLDLVGDDRRRGRPRSAHRDRDPERSRRRWRPPRRRAAPAAAACRRRPARRRRSTSSQSAVSATRRLTQPVTERPSQCSASGCEADPAALGLEPEEAAVGGRDPDRAAAVGGGGDPDQAGGDRRARAAAGAAGRCGRCSRGCGSRPRRRSR